MVPPCANSDGKTSKSKPTGQARRYCALGGHYLRRAHRTIQDRNLLNFGRRMCADLQHSSVICCICYDILEAIKLRIDHRHRVHMQPQMPDISSEEDEDQNEKQPMERREGPRANASAC